MKMHFERCILEGWVGAFYWAAEQMWKFALFFLITLQCVYVALANNQSWLLGVLLLQWAVLLVWLFTRDSYSVSYEVLIVKLKKTPRNFQSSIYSVLQRISDSSSNSSDPDFCGHSLICNESILQVSPSAKCLRVPRDCVKCSVVCRTCCSSRHGRDQDTSAECSGHRAVKGFLLGWPWHPQICLRPFILDKLHCDKFISEELMELFTFLLL